MNEQLDQWDDELSTESIVSRLLHLSPSEKNFKLGTEWVELLVSQAVREATEVESNN